MTDTKGRGFFRAGLAVVYVLAVLVFYWKYVPLIAPFQAILVPVLLSVLVFAGINVLWGTILFIFFFPLINNLPYFFGLFQTPHAPTALVLFLFYFLGCLIHWVRKPIAFDMKSPIFKPMLLFGSLVSLSAAITFLRYTNFFPFRSDRIYELTASVLPVSTGGALMSVVLFSLNYLTGFAFFFIIIQTLKSLSDLRKSLAALWLGAGLALLFGLYQQVKDIRLGNNPTSLVMELVSATFKDSLSFAAFLAMTIPLWIGLAIACKGARRWAAIFAAGLSIYMLLFTGSKGALLSLVVAILFFLALGLGNIYARIKSDSIPLKRPRKSTVLAFILMAIILFGLFAFKNPIREQIGGSVTLARLKWYGFAQGLNSENIKLLFQARTSQLWKMAVAMIRTYPLTGVGMGAYIIEVANYSALTKTPFDPESAENYILQVGAELGLFAVLVIAWVFWEILRQVRKSYREISAADPNRFILIGAASGIFAFLMIIQSHTFIGSYEVKYTFWLLVGVVFTLGRGGTNGIQKGVGKLLAGKKAKVACLIILLLYGTIHLWNSTHSLSLKSRTEQLGIKQEFGLDKLEMTADGREYRWTREYGGIPVNIEKPVLFLSIQASHPDIQQKPVNVRFYLVEEFFKRSRLIKELSLSHNDWQEVALPVTRDVGKDVILLIKVSRTWNPLKAKGVPDPRNLGVAVGKIRFKDTS